MNKFIPPFKITVQQKMNSNIDKVFVKATQKCWNAGPRWSALREE